MWCGFLPESRGKSSKLNLIARIPPKARPNQSLVGFCVDACYFRRSWKDPTEAFVSPIPSLSLITRRKRTFSEVSLVRNCCWCNVWPERSRSNSSNRISRRGPFPCRTEFPKRDPKCSTFRSKSPSLRLVVGLRTGNFLVQEEFFTKKLTPRGRC